MKLIICLFVTFLVISTSLFSEDSPHLILYFDINKTLIASDKAGNKSVNDVVNELLAEKYEACWDESLENPITFDAYVNKILVPGPKDDEELRSQRKFYHQHFIEYLQAHNHSLYKTVLQDYENVLTTLSTSNGTIFNSFYSLLNHLDQNEIFYSVVLRSFGEEVFEVKDEINTLYKTIFNQTGQFREGSLILEENKLIEGSNAIYTQLRRIEHTAIHDDWNYWNKNKMSTKKGKPFYIDHGDNETLSIFFDDNIKENDSNSNIIAPLNAATGELISIEELVESGQAVRVDTLKAILNDNYYINHVEEAIQKNRLKNDPTKEKLSLDKISWNIDFSNEIQSSNVKILPESTTEMDVLYDCLEKRYIKFLKFSRIFQPSILALDFSLSDITKDGARLTMIGNAAASDTKNCYFILRINGEFVMEFLAIDDFVWGPNGIEYTNTTKLSIPASYLQIGHNTIELELSNKGFRFYDLRSLTFVNNDH